ncbi:hypothetical protein BJ508DRAFT_366342 [Ascobolus immersus RN42]|uniref:Uncharacterized protein n=1 Tax=Ascobolus immersus RN42 TaxID=1160509 RepID=A0A3N4HQF0_ASCIM|nr:hypothetical protein BJ508DRAFT_366342 [Ascobolus immersus RN42]
MTSPAQARTYIFHATATPYLDLLSILHISHTDYTTQTLLILLAAGTITTYLLSIRWLSEKLLATDPPVMAFPEQDAPHGKKEVREGRKKQVVSNEEGGHHWSLRGLVYGASAVFFALPALYLHAHPPKDFPPLVLTLRPLLHFTFLSLALYLTLTLLLATIFLFCLERGLFFALRHLQLSRQRRIARRGRDAWIDPVDAGVIKVVKEVHRVVERMWGDVWGWEVWVGKRGGVWGGVAGGGGGGGGGRGGGRGGCGKEERRRV